MKLETDSVGECIERFLKAPEPSPVKAVTGQEGENFAPKSSGVTGELLSRCGFL